MLKVESIGQYGCMATGNGQDGLIDMVSPPSAAIKTTTFVALFHCSC